MASEVEKKYLIREDGKEYLAANSAKSDSSVQQLKDEAMKGGTQIKQGYLSVDVGKEIASKLNLHYDFAPAEARLRDKGGKMFLTLKGEGNLERGEVEQQIDSETFNKYWPQTAGKRIEKMRLKKPFAGHTMEIDIYLDRDLIVAEVEVPTAKDAEVLPEIGKDVTSDKKYKNKNLAK